MRVSATSLMAAERMPTSPGPSSATSTARGASTQSRVSVNSLPDRHQADALALAQRPVHHPDEDDGAVVGVEPRIEDQRPRGRRGVAARRRDALDDRLEDLVGADALLRAGQDRVRRVEPDGLLDLVAHALRLGARQVDLVEHRDDRMVVVEREVDVRHRLRLDALRRVHDQDGALARRQAARHLVGEVDVAGRVDQVEDVVAVRPGRGRRDARCAP